MQAIQTRKSDEASLRCPHCKLQGIFFPHAGVTEDSVFNDVRQTQQGVFQTLTRMGVRICSNPTCREPLFLRIDLGLDGKQSIKTFPQEAIAVDLSNIPSTIATTFREAVICRQNECYRSSAIMLRRTLEELCSERQAAGRDLKTRLEALRSNITVPNELMEAAQELRLLGNDAAHLESKVYDQIGAQEIDAAIDLCAELLKAVYQMSSLLSRLRSLSKAPPSSA